MIAFLTAYHLCPPRTYVAKQCISAPFKSNFFQKTGTDAISQGLPTIAICRLRLRLVFLLQQFGLLDLPFYVGQPTLLDKGLKGRTPLFRGLLARLSG